MCLLISLLQAASFYILYHTGDRNLVLGKPFTEIHLVSPTVLPSSAILSLSLNNKLSVGNNCSEVVSTISQILFNEHHIPCFSLRIFFSFNRQYQSTSTALQCTWPPWAPTLSLARWFFKHSCQTMSPSKHTVFYLCTESPDLTSSLVIVLYLFILLDLSLKEKPRGIIWTGRLVFPPWNQKMNSLRLHTPHQTTTVCTSLV